MAVAAIGGGLRYAHRPSADVALAPSETFVLTDHGVRIHGGEVSEPAFEAPIVEAPTAPLAPTAPSAGVSFTEEELAGNADIVREAAKSVAKLPAAQRKAQYEALMDTIQSHRDVAAEIRRKAPAHRTAGERALLQAVEAFDRLFDTLGDI